MEFGRSVEKCLKSHDDFETLLQFLSSFTGVPLSSSPYSLSSYFMTIFPDTNRTILMSCAKENCYDICRRVLEFFPQCLNIMNRQGYNALHYASFHGHLAVIKLLVQYGIHIHLKNSYHEYPFDSASIAGHCDVEYVLLSKFLLGFNPLAGVGEGDTITKFCDPTTQMSQPTKNYDFIESQNRNLWASSISFPLQLDDYLFKSSQLSGPHFSSPQPFPTPSDPNSFESLSFLQKHVLVVCRIISSDGMGETAVGKEYDLLPLVNATEPSSITIGRSHCNSIVLSDLSISKSHCELNYFEGIGLCVRDCKSRHGTAVDGVTVSSMASVKSDPQSVTKMATIKSPLSTITLGRVVLGFSLKTQSDSSLPHPPQTLAKRLPTEHFSLPNSPHSLLSSPCSFQPNHDIGKRFYEVARLSHQISQKKVPTNKSQQSQFYLDPLLPFHLISSIVDPPPPTTPNDIKPVSNQQSQSLRMSEDIDSENFVGRNLLLKMGWEKGVKLGKSGGVDEGPIQVMNKQDRSGLGMQGQLSAGTESHRFWQRKRKTGEGGDLN
jgi:hypothetical protein